LSRQESARALHRRWPSLIRRAQGMPGAVAPARLVCSKLRKNAHEQTTGTTETLRHSLRDGLRLIRDLPGVPGFLATIALRNVPQDLIPASGDQDHTISLVRRKRRSSDSAFRVHRNPPHVSRRLAVTSLWMSRAAPRQSHISDKRKQNIFHGRA